MINGRKLQVRYPKLDASATSARTHVVVLEMDNLTDNGLYRDRGTRYNDEDGIMVGEVSYYSYTSPFSPRVSHSSRSQLL